MAINKIFNERESLKAHVVCMEFQRRHSFMRKAFKKYLKVDVSVSVSDSLKFWICFFIHFDHKLFLVKASQCKAKRNCTNTLKNKLLKGGMGGEG